MNDRQSLSITFLDITDQFAFFWPSLLMAILDATKSLSITFLTISNEYTTFMFLNIFSQNGCQQPL